MWLLHGSGPKYRRKAEQCIPQKEALETVASLVLAALMLVEMGLPVTPEPSIWQEIVRKPLEQR